MPESRSDDCNDAQPDAVIAGTLCLMSCYVQHPVALYADRIAANLNQMARFSMLTPELRTICRRLAERWDGIRSGANARARAGERASDDRALH